MIDIVEKGTEWVERWQEVTFTPSHLFAKAKFRLDSTAFLFASGALLIGYFAAMFGAAVYFAVYFRAYFASNLCTAEQVKQEIELITAVSGLYIGAMIASLIFTSALSYFAYKRAGSLRTFSDHFASELHFFNAEPIAAIALTIAFINYRNRHLVLEVGVVLLFIATRAYYLFLAFIAFRELHRPSPKRQWAAYLIGYLPSALVGIGIQLLVVAILSLLVTNVLDLPRNPCPIGVHSNAAGTT